MKKACMVTKSIAVLAFTVILMITGVFLCFGSLAYAESGIRYSDPITVEYTDGVYSYGNNGYTLTSDSLQSVIDAVARNASSNIILNFKNISTNEQLTLDYSYTVVMQGSLNYAGELSPFITVKSNELRLQGVDIVSSVTAISVGENARLNSYSGTVKTASKKAVLTSTISNYGAVSVDGGVIVYDNSLTQGSGTAISQYGVSSSLTLVKGRIEGNSGIQINQGTASLVGGTVSATHSYSENIANGYAVMVCNNGNVTVDGANINSVTPPRAVIIDGGSNSSFNYCSGRIDGNIVLNRAGTDFTAVKIGNKRIYPDQNGSVYLYSPQKVLEQLSDFYLGVECNSGFYVKEWSESIEIASPKLSDFSGEAVKVILDNRYKITLTLGNKSETLLFDYNSTVYPHVWGFTPSDGQSILYWRDSLGERVDLPIKVTKDESYTAVLDIADTVIEHIEDISAVYGDDISLEARFERVESLSYEYIWQRLEKVSISDGQGGMVISTQFVTVSESEKCIVKGVSESGRYRLKLITSLGSVEKINYSNEFTVTIEKADYNGIVHADIFGVYSPDKKLSDYLLSDGFSWVNADIVPTVNVTKYEANYCGDHENYNAYPLFINLILQKHEAVRNTYPYNYYQNESFVYNANKTLTDYPLGENWRWADGSITPTVDNEGYIACYNPDSINYEDYKCLIKMIITKAQAEKGEPLSYNATFRYGLTIKNALTDGKLPKNYYFINVSDVDMVIEQFGSKKIDIYYNRDPLNYENYTTTLTINAIRVMESEREYPEAIFIPFAETLKLSDIRLNDGWRWSSGEQSIKYGKNTYSATYSSDYALYEPFVTEIEIVAYDSSIKVDDINIRYSEDLTLGSISLPNGYSWVEDVRLGVGDYTFRAIYSSAEWDLLYIDIIVSVSKGIYDISDIVFEDKTVPYDGIPHTIECVGILPDGVSSKVYCDQYPGISSFTDAGEYRFILEFTVSNTNYEPITSKCATLTINPIEYDLTDIWEDLTVVYDGKEHILECNEEKLPEGVSIVSYIGDNCFVNSGTYSVGIAFYQVDDRNHLPLDTVYRTLTIQKAEGSVVGNSRQTVIYDGKPHSPLVLSANSEQTPISDGISSFVDTGRYEVTYRVEESVNYKAFSKTIEFIILPKTLQAENGMSGSVFSENGIYGNVLRIDIVANENGNLDISILIDDIPITNNYTVTIDLSKIANSKNIELYADIDGVYEPIMYTLSDNNITFNSVASAYRLCINEENTPIWVWILIINSIVLLITCVLLIVWVIVKKKNIILKRRKKEQ